VSNLAKLIIDELQSLLGIHNTFANYMTKNKWTPTYNDQVRLHPLLTGK